MLEVVLLGRSVGECVLVRFGPDRWAIVDSFVSRREPAPLRFLRHVGADPQHIRIVLASHWHNDHVRGLVEVLDVAASDAQFYFPEVVDPPKLARLVASSEAVRAKYGHRGGADAFGSVLERAAERRLRRIPIGSGKLLWRREDVVILALSPTSAAFEAGMAAVGRELINEPSRRARAATMMPNLTSIALWIEGPQHRALLGADLEAHSDFGWKAAISETATLRLPGRAQLLKVPHHGSKNADDPMTWDELLFRPQAAIAPYAPSRLPTAAQVKDLERPPKQATVRIAAGPHWGGRKVNRLLQAAVPPHSAVPVGARFGFVHYAGEPDGAWRILDEGLL